MLMLIKTAPYQNRKQCRRT